MKWLAAFVALTVPAEAHDWQLRAYNTSSATSVTVLMNGVEIGHCGSGRDCTFVLNGPMQAPYDAFALASPPAPKYLNTLDVLVTSQRGAWSYAFDVVKDGVTVMTVGCGQRGGSPCGLGLSDPDHPVIVAQTVLALDK